MFHAQGFVEFRQLGEWYGIIDIGTLLVPNRQLSIYLLDHALKLKQAAVPEDASVAIMECVEVVGEQNIEAAAFFSFHQIVALHLAGDEEHIALFHETLFSLLLDLCRTLSNHFGEDEVRLVLYFG